MFHFDFDLDRFKKMKQKQKKQKTNKQTNKQKQKQAAIQKISFNFETKFDSCTCLLCVYALMLVIAKFSFNLLVLHYERYTEAHLERDP